MDDEFECGNVIHEKGALLLSAIGIGGDINPVALSEQGAILHSHRWEERPIYGIWRGELLKWYGNGEWPFYTAHKGVAIIAQARVGFGKVCIIGDDGQPVELDE